MGHDILGFNKAGGEIAYARFSMGNYNATILYTILNAQKYYAGVSGVGKSTTFTQQQFEDALNAYNQLFAKGGALSEINFPSWDKKQIMDFIQNCLETAQKEETVKVYFG